MEEWRDGSVRRRLRAEDTGPCCTVTLFSSDTPSAGWLVTCRSSSDLLDLLRVVWKFDVLCCSIWPVWRRLGLWRINSRLMWDFKKTQQVKHDCSGWRWNWIHSVSRLRDGLESSDDLCVFSRWGLLVDDPSRVQTEIRGGESANRRWSHSRQRFVGALSSEYQINRTYTLLLIFFRCEIHLWNHERSVWCDYIYFPPKSKEKNT